MRRSRGNDTAILYVIPITGMHCRSCEITLKDLFESLPEVEKAVVSVRAKTATIYARRKPHRSVIEKIVHNAGYTIGKDQAPWLNRTRGVYRDVGIGIVFVALLAVLFRYFDIAEMNTGSLIGSGVVAALLIGVTAGFSTCMALVGGLVLGLSAKHAEKHPSATVAQKFRPHIYFNASRIVSFFVLGGVIGTLGSIIQINGTVIGILTILVGGVMLLLGLQLTTIFPRLSNGGITLPSSIARRLGLHHHKQKEYSHRNSAVLGALSFFLPCGFTQAMQLYAISSGSFIEGALVMSLFAVGTAPSLLSVGGLTSTVSGIHATRFFKFAAVAVIAMAVLNITNGYRLTGWPRPFENTASTPAQTSPPIVFTPLNGQVEQVAPIIPESVVDNRLRASYTLASGMVPNSFTVPAGGDYVLEVNPLEDGVGCMSTIVIPGLNNSVQYLRKGDINKLSFRAKRPGTYQITCAMGVPHGTISVI